MLKITQFILGSLVAMLLATCSNSPGEIEVRLLFHDDVTPASRDSISEFIFFVQYQGPSQTKIQIYPEACGGKEDPDDPESDDCLAHPPCGFPAEDPEFHPTIPFFDDRGAALFPEGVDLEFFACGLTTGHGLIASGYDPSVPNTPGQGTIVTMSDTDLSACNQMMLSDCP